MLAEAHELAQARILLLETTLDLLELLLVAEALLGELGLYHFVRFLHLDRLVILNHDLVEAVAQNSNLAHHWVVIVVQLSCH